LENSINFIENENFCKPAGNELFGLTPFIPEVEPVQLKTSRKSKL
jgi:hypothetical protein